MYLLIIALVTSLNSKDAGGSIILDWTSWIKRLTIVVWSVLQVSAKSVSNQRSGDHSELLVSEGLSFSVNCVVKSIEWRIFDCHEVCVDARVEEVDNECA